MLKQYPAIFMLVRIVVLNFLYLLPFNFIAMHSLIYMLILLAVTHINRLSTFARTFFGLTFFRAIRSTAKFKR